MSRLPIPELSAERRKDLIKVVHNRAEKARIEIRTARRDANEAAKKAQRQSEIGEDDLAALTKKVQDLTDKAIEEIGTVMAQKEKDLMQV